jgi:hypothetical protein|tara:strand:- start:628 stop:744 length:117 start_codon:yes stop_codon:yes gene_type:complete
MIDKLKNKAQVWLKNFHWQNHKVCIAIIAVLIIAYIVK